MIIIVIYWHWQQTQWQELKINHDFEYNVDNFNIVKKAKQIKL